MANTQRANRQTETAPTALNVNANDQMARARAARGDNIPPDERKLIDEAKALRDRRDATKDEDEKATLTKTLKAVEDQRKSLAFVRKAGDLWFECQELAKKLTSHAGPNYKASPEQRAKVAAMFSTELARALKEYDTQPASDTAGETAKDRKRAARAAARNLFA